MLVFSAVFRRPHALLRLQGHLPELDGLKGAPPHIALNTTASFVTNTNRQYYGGEYTMSYLPDGFYRRTELRLGGSRDGCGGCSRLRTTVVRRTREPCRSLPVGCLHPRAAHGSARGHPRLTRRIQTFHGHATATTLQGAHQSIARGPVASQVAIKQLGTNGGGFYNSNSAVPFENPNGLTNFIELLTILLIPAAQVFMFGRMIAARRQAWPVFGAMFALFAVGVAIALPTEQHGSQVLRASGVNISRTRAERRQHGRQGSSPGDRQHCGRPRRRMPPTARVSAATMR